MRVLIVLLASTLAIEDLERDALGAPGPTRANLRGLKFGHSVTEVEEEATDPPAPSPTNQAGTHPFLESLDCADCPDCTVVDPSLYEDNNLRVFEGDCICYVGSVDLKYGAWFQGSNGDDCIAITGDFTTYESHGFLNWIWGGGGADMIVLPTIDDEADAVDQGITVFGGLGDYDICPVWADCELAY